MKRLLIAFALIAVLFIVGWLTVSHSANRTSINVETEQIKEDTERMTDEAREIIDDAGEKTQELRHDVDEHLDDSPAAPTADSTAPLTRQSNDSP